MANVLLLRSPSQETPDPYGESFENLGYKPSFVPVLETVFTNFEVFKRTVVFGSKTQDFTGVIITSARACEAWGHIVKDLMQVPLGNAG
jgi:uroporphyrinogen-III synthase